MNCIVYKYLSPERISYFEDELLRFTQPSELNDSFECMPAYPTDQDAIKFAKSWYKREMRESKKNERPKLRKEMKTEIDKIIKRSPKNIRDVMFDTLLNIINQTVILSLSKRWNSNLMWSHYSASHTGFCIGFDWDFRCLADQDEYEDEDDAEKHMRAVSYKNKRLEISLNKKFEEIDFDFQFVKSKDWKYEKEVRKISHIHAAKKVIRKDPYDICLFKVSHVFISEIILGQRCSNELTELISNFCRKKNIPIYRAQPSDIGFDMIRSKELALKLNYGIYHPNKDVYSHLHNPLLEEE